MRVVGEEERERGQGKEKERESEREKEKREPFDKYVSTSAKATPDFSPVWIFDIGSRGGVQLRKKMSYERERESVCVCVCEFEKCV